MEKETGSERKEKREQFVHSLRKKHIDDILKEKRNLHMGIKTDSRELRDYQGYCNELKLAWKRGDTPAMYSLLISMDKLATSNYDSDNPKITQNELFEESYSADVFQAVFWYMKNCRDDQVEAGVYLLFNFTLNSDLKVIQGMLDMKLDEEFYKIAEQYAEKQPNAAKYAMKGLANLYSDFPEIISPFVGTSKMENMIALCEKHCRNASMIEGSIQFIAAILALRLDKIKEYIKSNFIEAVVEYLKIGIDVYQLRDCLTIIEALTDAINGEDETPIYRLDLFLIELDLLSQLAKILDDSNSEPKLLILVFRALGNMKISQNHKLLSAVIQHIGVSENPLVLREAVWAVSNMIQSKCNSLSDPFILDDFVYKFCIEALVGQNSMTLKKHCAKCLRGILENISDNELKKRICDEPKRFIDYLFDIAGKFDHEKDGVGVSLMLRCLEPVIHTYREDRGNNQCVEYIKNTIEHIEFLDKAYNNELNSRDASIKRAVDSLVDGYFTVDNN